MSVAVDSCLPRFVPQEPLGLTNTILAERDAYKARAEKAEAERDDLRQEVQAAWAGTVPVDENETLSEAVERIMRACNLAREREESAEREADRQRAKANALVLTVGRLEEEVERLRELLREIVTVDVREMYHADWHREEAPFPCYCDWTDNRPCSFCRARAALDGEE